MWTPWVDPGFLQVLRGLTGAVHDRRQRACCVSFVPVTKLVFFFFDFFRTGPQHREPKEGDLSAFGRAGSVVRSGWFVCLLFFPDLGQ